MNQFAMLFEGDAVHLAVAALLLLMSVASWTVMLWKALLLWQADHRLPIERKAEA